jgi:hypothetical protein
MGREGKNTGLDGPLCIDRRTPAFEVSKQSGGQNHHKVKIAWPKLGENTRKAFCNAGLGNNHVAPIRKAGGQGML